MSLLLLLFIFLGFSCVLSASAIPAATRTQILEGEEDAPALPSLAKVKHLFGNVEEVLVDRDEGFMDRRIDLETQDYEGTGANRDHDPKSPGTLTP
ncbi:hypothetical protein RJT34_21689 [Clitoria ternatea]|uniref:Uncharacterized protein n=1 Tax=Clitoria ternatea TaxID=43366 RepID=A0AAN9IVA3_CLITE